MHLYSSKTKSIMLPICFTRKYSCPGSSDHIDRFRMLWNSFPGVTVASRFPTTLHISRQWWKLRIQHWYSECAMTFPLPLVLQCTIHLHVQVTCLLIDTLFHTGHGAVLLVNALNHIVVNQQPTLTVGESLQFVIDENLFVYSISISFRTIVA